MKNSLLLQSSPSGKHNFPVPSCGCRPQSAGYVSSTPVDTGSFVPSSMNGPPRALGWGRDEDPKKGSPLGPWKMLGKMDMKALRSWPWVDSGAKSTRNVNSCIVSIFYPFTGGCYLTEAPGKTEG